MPLLTQKAAMVEELRIAIRDILQIHNQQVERVLQGDFSTADETENRLKIVRETKNLITDRYREHVMAHGC
jgi:hypothetical protein